jgi:hypothetical protein
VTYIYPEPYTGNNWLARFIVENKINTVMGTVIGIVGTVVGIAILVGLALLFRKICNPAVKFALSEERYKNLTELT